MGEEFEEISHTGGKCTYTVETRDGRRMYQLGWEHSGPRPATLFALWAIPQGHAVATLILGGIGQPMGASPIPGCFPVFMASDSEGMFGHSCPECSGYWRSFGAAGVCPYCGIIGESHEFLTEAQHRYVKHSCEMLARGLEAPEDGKYVIDMDAVRAENKNKPAFYYSAERQQTLRKCPHCGGRDDILGRFGYCSSCGTRNDLLEFEAGVDLLRVRINGEVECSRLICEAVSQFDSMAGQYMRQLVARVPMTPQRQSRLSKMRFHDLHGAAAEFKNVFDITLLDGASQADIDFASRLFFRRHVYEHRGGEVDEKYLRDSGDTGVRLKQMLREDRETAHRLCGLLVRFARSLHRDFHLICPPDGAAISNHAAQARLTGEG